MANFDEGNPPKRMKTDGSDNRPAFYNYSGNQQPRGRGNRGREREPRDDDESKLNHILLMTVLRPSYPITCDIIHTIASPLGKVLRIVIFRKNGVQALVEFENVEAAKKVKQYLHGADIYSGCCTLRIEYGKPDRLNVHRNDKDSYDYTSPNSFDDGGDAQQGQRTGPLLENPPNFGATPQPYRGGPPRRGNMYGGHNEEEDYNEYAPDSSYGHESDHYGGGPMERSENHEKFGGGRENFRNGSSGRGPSSSNLNQSHNAGRHGDPQGGAVIMVYGMNHEKMNCNKVFNLFCLYGNVMKVKFLKTKEGCAMVQMGDPVSVDRAVYNLKHVEFLDHKLQLTFSKQPFLNDVQNPHDLPDGTPSFKNFIGNRHNRFSNPEAASKNRISPPTKLLHFFNTPFGITEDELRTIFADNELVPPVNITMFPSKTERSSSGLMEFETVPQAIEAIAVCNHTAITNKENKFPFMMKLCFSTSRQ